MSLFNFGKKKEEEKKTTACTCNCGCPTSEANEISNDCCAEAKTVSAVLRCWVQAANPATSNMNMQKKQLNQWDCPLRLNISQICKK